MAEELGSAAVIRDFRTRLGVTPEKAATRLGVSFPAVRRSANGWTKLSPLPTQGLMELLRRMGKDGEGLMRRLFESDPTGKVQPE